MTSSFEIPPELVDELTATMRKVFGAWLDDYDKAQRELDDKPTDELRAEANQLWWELVTDDDDALREALTTLGVGSEAIERFMEERFAAYMQRRCALNHLAHAQGQGKAS